ncbi:MAG: glycosyltransferase [Pyrinomonadaceae bacterium]
MSEIKIVKKPVLSVILASQNARQSAEKCLREIENQCVKNNVEIIIVDNSTDKTAEIIAQRFPALKLVKASQNKLIPELWKIGIDESAGDLVALSTTHFVPAKNWIAEIRAAHESPFAGIGGAIENDERAGLVSWAVYFCRYSRYMLPFAQENVEDFAADNASYKRADLERVRGSWTNGFWEVFVHRAMIKEKMQLILSPEIIVYHQDSFTFSGFMRQRFAHGKQFGNARAGNISGAKRIALITLSPLIPFLYIYRITKRVFSRKRNIDKYFLSLPVLFLFLLSWSLGEFCGYLADNAETRMK